MLDQRRRNSPSDKFNQNPNDPASELKQKQSHLLPPPNPSEVSEQEPQRMSAWVTRRRNSRWCSKP